MADKLTEPQRRILLASEPNERTGDGGFGVELNTAGDIQAAKALERKQFGTIEGLGGSFAPLYFNNWYGLRERSTHLSQDRLED